MKLVVLSLATLVAAGILVQAASTPATAELASETTPTIGYLETQTHRIAIQAGDVYTIAAKDGTVLAENVTLEQLQASNPELHEVLERSIAAAKETVIDASVIQSIDPK